MSEPHYTYRVEWSPEDDEWVGLVAEFPSLSWLAPDPVDAVRGVRDLVDGVVADMRETGETPPEPLAERRYSGRVFLRTSPELHRRLTIEAAEQGVSVNQWAIQKLAAERGIGELAVASVARLWYADAEARNEFAALVAQGHAALQDSGARERYAAALRAVFESASLSATGEHLSAAHDDDIALRT